MLGVDNEIGTSALRLWVTAGSAALLVVLCGLTFVLPTTRTAEAVRAILVAVGAVLGAAITWASFGGSSNASVERRALELRGAELTARALPPARRLPVSMRWRARRSRPMREGDLRFARERGERHGLCRRAARAPYRHHRLCRTQWRGHRRRAAAASRTRDRPVRLSPPRAGGARQLHQRELQDARPSPRSEPSAHQPARGNLQPLFGVLFADLGQSVGACGRGSAAGPGSSTSGAGECVGPA